MFRVIMPLCNRRFCCIFGWYFYIEIRLKYEKNILLSSSRAFSLSTPTSLLSTPVENSEATWKKATKCNKGFIPTNDNGADKPGFKLLSKEDLAQESVGRLESTKTQWGQNRCWKLGQLFCFDIDNGLNHSFFMNKTFLFYKIKIWNFQHLFEKEFHETSQISTQSDNNCLNELNELKFCEASRNTKQMLKVSAFYLEKQKSFIPKKNMFLAIVSKYAKIVQKVALAVLIFSEGFGQIDLKFDHWYCYSWVNRRVYYHFDRLLNSTVVIK